MKPSHIASFLRRVASRIDSSVRPSKGSVARDVRTVLAALDMDDVAMKSALDKVAAQLEGFEVSVGLVDGTTHDTTIKNVKDVRSNGQVDCTVDLGNGTSFKLPEDSKSPDGAAVSNTLQHLVDVLLGDALKS